jgi:uncharacterized repeat protein (TIGR01451 family)
VQGAALSVKKTADVAGFAAAGEPIIYTYAVTNTGSVDLGGITVTDSKLGPVSGCATTLTPGQSTTCTASYVTTPADVAAQDVVNVVIVGGTDPAGEFASASALLIIPQVRFGEISLAKTADVGTFAAAGEHIIYSYVVTNSGNVPLSGVTVTDPRVPSLVCGPFTLAEGAAKTCTGTYTTTAADVAAGRILNIATATGLTAGGIRLSATADVLVLLTEKPEVGIRKAGPSGFVAAGETLEYIYTINNTGNVPLHRVRVIDNKAGAVTDCPATLRLGQMATCTAIYVTTPADVAAGEVANTATVTGTAPSGATVTAHASLTVPLRKRGAIAIAKSASPAAFSAAGTVITYTYVVKNTGNVPLHGVDVTDSRLGAVPCPASSLAASASMTCTTRYTTTDDDVAAGGVTNTGSATALTPSGARVRAHSTVTLPFTPVPPPPPVPPARVPEVVTAVEVTG